MNRMKKIAHIIIAALMCFSFTTAALAADTFDLGEMNVRNNDTQRGWATDGVADTKKGIPVEKFTTAETLVLEFSEPPQGGMQIIWQGDGSWDWNQQDSIIPNEGMTEKKLVIKLKDSLKNYAAFKASKEEIKLFLAYYSNTVADLKITKAYFTYTELGGNTNTNTNPSTGDGHTFAVALVTLISAGTAALLLGKKSKKTHN